MYMCWEGVVYSEFWHFIAIGRFTRLPVMLFHIIWLLILRGILLWYSMRDFWHLRDTLAVKFVVIFVLMLVYVHS